ncbi:hypothetical protein VM1G_04420 [Cytospora mali]|uniref:Uncharacterized protein n=1 Tax=Cytospora mali TaxID=578113 RepID=A0A194VXQ6_CYTMA|nr:hypothetical protein VM1G_04420 [Valsa mali]
MTDILNELVSLGEALFRHPNPKERRFASEILTVLFQHDTLQDRDNYARVLFHRQTFDQLQQELTSDSHPGTIGNLPQSNSPEDEEDDAYILPLARTLNALSLSGGQEPLEKRTPLSLLQAMVESFFTFGPNMASFLFSKLQMAVRFENFEITASSRLKVGTLVQLPSMDLKKFPWNSCKMSASLVLLLAAHATPESLYETLKTQSRSMGGMPTRESLASSISDSLSVKFQRAKRAALEEGKTTVMGVTLVDKYIFELLGRSVAEDYFSFSHTFVMGVGPEGVVIWQGFGEHGYRLDEYIRDGHAGVRSWDEAKQFVADFEKLASAKGIWSAKINKLYKKLFLVDINSICSADGPERPVTPRFKAHVKIHCINDVQCQDVTKILWTTNSKWS